MWYAMIQLEEKNKEQIADKLIAYLRDEFGDSMIAYESPLTQIKGGFETYIYRFELKGVQEELNPRLVLRLYPENREPGNAVWESSVQNTLADAGYPVPRARLICTDKAILGGVFFIMDFMPGKPMMTAPIKKIPKKLGEIHAILHRIDPRLLIKSLNKQGFDKNRYLFKKTFETDLKAAKKSKIPWVCETAKWLIKNRPPEPDRLAICHGDFHPINILTQEGKITGVLDWGGVTIADPVMDIANTIKLITIYTKYISLGPEYDSVDWDMISRMYLDTYRDHFPLDSNKLDYYGVVQCLRSLIDGLMGIQALRHPPLVKDMLDFINKVTGIRIPEPIEFEYWR